MRQVRPALSPPFPSPPGSLPRTPHLEAITPLNSHGPFCRKAELGGSDIMVLESRRPASPFAPRQDSG